MTTAVMGRRTDPATTGRMIDPAAVGRIGLGCMGMSWAYRESERDDASAVRLIRSALDLGVTFLDTADIYGDGHNERLVGTALWGHRDRAFLATKVGLVVDDLVTRSMHRDGRPEHVRRAVDASLARLGTDHVDLLYLHRVDPAVPLADTWGAMAELVAAGKVTRLGLSEVGVAEAAQAHAIHPVAAVQSELSLWTRGPLAGDGSPAGGIVAWCALNGALFVPFAPLGRGFLTGTIRSAAFEDSDFRAGNPRFATPALAANLAIVDVVRRVAERRGATPAQVALAWLLAQGAHVVPIPGTKKEHFLWENAVAAALLLTAADLDELDGMPAAVGERY